jgi:hypothetical protein
MAPSAAKYETKSMIPGIQIERYCFIIYIDEIKAGGPFTAVIAHLRR